MRKGQKASDETKRRMSLARKGISLSAEHKAKCEECHKKTDTFGSRISNYKLKNEIQF
jgi:hypothetical protein